MSYPISGLDLEEVRKNSLQDKETLVALGWTLINPTEVIACEWCNSGVSQSGHEHTWSEWMKADLREMLTCEAIVMCDGWETSPGARMEFYLAVSAGLQPYLLSNWPNGGIFLTDMTNGRSRRLR